jgi:hypothetical protein
MPENTTEGGNKEFREFLRSSPNLDEASSGENTELTGLVSRTDQAGKFAITTGDGKTYELPVEAVQKFRTTSGPGLTAVATVQVASELLKNPTIRQVKPLIKDMIKDPIKDIIHDGTLTKDIHKDPIIDTPTAKDIHKDPVYDTPATKDIHKDPIETLAAKDVHTDPIADTPAAKDVRTDPAIDKPLFKDIHKDPLNDPVGTLFADLGTGPGDPITSPDPAGQITNPAIAAGFAAQAAGAMPFVMATPHQAPQHLVNLQAGMPQAAAALGGAQLKQLGHDTIKEVAWAETVKEPIRDTWKEMIHDTRKELVWDTWQEQVFDPGQFGQPGPMFGMPGFM